MEPYRYEAIPYPDYLEQTRILTLSPGKPSDSLIGGLATLSTTDPQPFEALSYVWGRVSSWDSIVCDGKAIKVTTGLTVALRHLRHQARPRVLWVDQICINQEDLMERSQQVRHMNVIYRKANKVLVWPGEDTNRLAEPAFTLIEYLAQINQHTQHTEEFKRNQADMGWSCFSSHAWLALGKLFKQPWFDRKWILQEIGTDSKAVLFWGNSCIAWDRVSAAAYLLKTHGYALRRRYDLLVWKPWYMNKLFSKSSYKSKPLNFVYELHRARWQFASDPRDHIFALLGHPAAQEGPDEQRVMEADYTKPVEEVYHDFTLRMLQRGESLMVLNVVQHESVQSSITKHSIPTWVVQWDSQKSLHNLLGDDMCVYRASKDVLPTPKFLHNNKVLVIDGVIIDTLSTTSEILHTPYLTLDSSMVAKIWQSQHECDGAGFCTESKYRSGEAALFAFLETLSAVKKRPDEPPIPEAKRLADAADFVVKGFGKSHLVGADLIEMSQAGNCYSWMERASGGANGRRFVRGEQGYYALCPPATEIGDKLCLLLGGQTTYCLRPSRDEYYFVGECYVHGVMNGECLDMLENGKVEQTSFSIR